MNYNSERFDSIAERSVRPEYMRHIRPGDNPEEFVGGWKMKEQYRRQIARRRFWENFLVTAIAALIGLVGMAIYGLARFLL